MSSNYMVITMTSELARIQLIKADVTWQAKMTNNVLCQVYQTSLDVVLFVRQQEGFEDIIWHQFQPYWCHSKEHSVSFLDLLVSNS